MPFLKKVFSRESAHTLARTPVQVGWLLVALLLMPVIGALPAYAQHDVAGRVVDAEDGGTLPGVNIVVKGTQIGTATRVNGEFNLRVPNANDTLVVSFVGYQQTEVAIAGRNQIDIPLERAITSLEEVVVSVPFGEQTVATITGSVSQVTGEVLDLIPTSNLSQTLQGTVPGLIGVTSSGRPGRDNSTLLIRGISTLNNNAPLIVIDGIPGRQGGLERLNPADIASVTVLKDASAAIYGSRAANGVILVTTKKGRAGQTRWDINVERGWAQPAIVPEMADAATYMTMLNEIDVSRGNPPRYTQEEIENHRRGADPWLYPNTDWYDVAMKDFAREIMANASVTGGSENIRYRLSAEAISEDGIMINSAEAYDQFGFRTYIDGDLNRYLNLSVNIHGRFEDRDLPAWTREDANNPSGNAAWELLQRGKPNEPAFWPNGLPGPDQENGVNPVVSDATGYDNSKTYYFQSNVTASLKVPGVEGWTIDGTVAYDRMFWNRKRWQKPWTLYHWDYVTRDSNGEPLLTPVQSGVPEPRLSQESDNEMDLLLRATTHYQRTFGGSHNTTFLLGTEWQKGKRDELFLFRRFFSTDVLDYLFAGGTGQQNLDGRGFHEARLNFFGRINYDYQQKYLLELIARYDGSYIFPEDDRFGFFPSISAGWRIDQEPWFNSLTGNFFDRLKIRASYGQTGNDQIEPYQFLPTFGFNGQYAYADGLATRISPTRVPNPDITWEVATQFDIGLQGGILGERLSFDITYFRHFRDDILWWRSEAVPQIAGFSLPRENIAQMSNRGIEGELAFSQRISNKVQFRAGANLTYVEDEVEYFAEAEGVLPWQRNTGQPWNTGLFYIADGIFHTQEEVDNYPHWPDARPGDIKFVDYNNDGVIDGQDRVREGENGTPDIIGAFNMGASVGNFDFYVLFQGAAQVRQYVRAGGVGEFGNFFKEDADKRWTPENPNAEGPRAWNREDPYWASNNNTYFLRDAKYLRLKSARIAYTLPQRWLQGLGSNSQIQIYLSGRNLLTWSPLKTMDPEIRNQAAHEYPLERSYTIGLQMGF